MILRIRVSVVPANKVVGAYGVNDEKRKPKLKYNELVTTGSMPERALYLHPLVAASYVADLHPAGVAVSDMFRSGESSMNAVQRGRGAQPPGFSLHNYGTAIDLRIAETMARMRDNGIPIKTKKDLDVWMEAHGWYCHRTDHQLDSEAWHYNALFLYQALGFTQKAVVIDPKKYAATSGWAEELLKRLYRDQFLPDNEACQEALKAKGYYHGAVDGDIGPQSKAAIAAFQRAWGYGGKDKDGKDRWTLRQDGKLDDRTRRTIAFIRSEKEIVPMPAPFKLAA